MRAFQRVFKEKRRQIFPKSARGLAQSKSFARSSPQRWAFSRQRMAVKTVAVATVRASAPQVDLAGGWVSQFEIPQHFFCSSPCSLPGLSGENAEEAFMTEAPGVHREPQRISN